MYGRSYGLNFHILEICSENFDFSDLLSFEFQKSDKKVQIDRLVGFRAEKVDLAYIYPVYVVG